MFFDIDHLVFCGTRADRTRLAERLGPAGFVAVPGKLRFDKLGVHSESLAYRGGGYVEIVYQVEPDRAPAVWFAPEMPRLMGIGFSTDSFDEDTAGWLWTMDEEQILDDGSRLRIHAAGPHEHLSEFYVFAMDRPDRTLDHPQLCGTAELVALTFSGAEHVRWRECLEDSLGLDGHVGAIELRFEPGPHPRVAATPTFRVRAADGVVPLATGAIRLAP